MKDLVRRLVARRLAGAPTVTGVARSACPGIPLGYSLRAGLLSNANRFDLLSWIFG